MVTDKNQYPDEAFRFVQEGLRHTVDLTHGRPTPKQAAVLEYLAASNIDLEELAQMYYRSELPPKIKRLIDAADGIETFDRHVSGQQLCWGLRDYALKRWGFMAGAVLGRWKIKSTLDLGHIVYTMIDQSQLQRQSTDRIEDFQDVFDFDEVFDKTYSIKCDDLDESKA